MTRIRPAILCLVGIVLISTQAFAQDDAKKKKRGNQQFAKNIMRPFGKADLSKEQTEKATAIIKKHQESIISIQKELNGTFDADQKKARRAAQKKARAEGLKGKKAQDFIWKELGIDDEARQKYQKKNRELNQLRVKIQREIHGLLSDDQRANVKIRGGKGGGKKKKKDDGGGQ